MEFENKDLNRELVEKISEARNEPGWMLKKRLDAFDQFKELPFPKFKYGLSIVLNCDLDFSKLNFKELEKPINFESPEHEQIEIMDFNKALNERIILL